jgi:phage-related protein
MGEAAPNVNALKGFGGGVLEVLEDHDGDPYRAVCTVRFEDAVYVLHVFQKKGDERHPNTAGGARRGAGATAGGRTASS